MTTPQSSKTEKALRFITVQQPDMVVSRKQTAAVFGEWMRERYYYNVVAPDGLDLFIRADSVYAQWRAFGLNKEPHFFDWVNFHINTGDVVYDVGANVGVMAMAIAKLKHNKVEVHAFEPVAASFGQLQENCVFNGLRGIRCWPIALLDRDGSFVMNLDSYQAGASLHDIMQDSHEVRNPSWAITFRADSLPERLGIDEPHHMKIDVDGMEPLVLDGMKGLLEGDTLQTVMIEVDRQFLDMVKKTMAGYGFGIEGEWEHMKKDGSWDTKDILFVRGA